MPFIHAIFFGSYTFPSNLCIFKLLRYLFINFFDATIKTTSKTVIQSLWCCPDHKCPWTDL